MNVELLMKAISQILSERENAKIKIVAVKKECKEVIQ